MLLKERHTTAQVLDKWRMMWTPWWEDPKALSGGLNEADVWRVRTTKGGVFELVQLGKDWLCYKAYD